MQYTLNVHGHLLDLSRPCVMGILNCTPDSFFVGSRKQTDAEIARRANQIVAEGGMIIDVGAYSTRPGANEVSGEEEMERLRLALSIVCREQPAAIVSVDTFRPSVVRMAVEEFGVDIINDVSAGNAAGVFGGDADCDQPDTDYPEMFQMAARLKVPYVLMSTKPSVNEMLMSFSRQVQQLRDLGQKDILLDPGFGFGKTVEQNYAVMSHLDRLHMVGLPLLVGISRKSMIWKLLGSSPEEALNGTTVLNTAALLKGASVLRVHDVKQATEVVKICLNLA